MQRIVFWILLLMSGHVQAKHIIGGEVTYSCQGYTDGNPATNSRAYQFTMTIYRDCQSDGASFDSAPGGFTDASVTIYLSGQQNPYRTIYLDAPVVTMIDPNPGNPCLEVPDIVCVERGVYSFPVLDLPIEDKSYYIVYQRCCRNQTITNILDPRNAGATYFMELTKESQALCNSSPAFSETPPIVLCANSPFEYSLGAEDPDGDQLLYEFCSPFDGGGRLGSSFSLNGVAPDPDAPPPYTNVTFKAPQFSVAEPLGEGSLSLDPQTGLLTGAPQFIGQFVVGICVTEYRGSTILSRVRRDVQFNVTTCEATVIAEIEALNSGPDQFTIEQCGDSTVQLINSSSQDRFINGYEWTFTGENNYEFQTQQASPRLELPGVGNYRGRLVVNPGTNLCSDTAQIHINIYPNLAADFGFEYDTCSTAAVAFQDRSLFGASPATWEWSMGDGSQYNYDQHPLHNYNEPGVWPVQLTITDENGCQDQLTRNISYFPIPPVIVIAPKIKEACAPQVVFFENLSRPINEDYTITWNFGDGSAESNIINPFHEYSEAGNYDVALRIVSPVGCSNDTVFNELVRLLPRPKVDFDIITQGITSRNPQVSFQDRSEGTVRWFWDFSGLGTSIHPNPTFTFRDTGLRQVMLIGTHPSGCRDTSIQWIDLVPVADFYMPNAFTPNGDGLNDVFIGKGDIDLISDFRLQIWNRWGEMFFSSTDPLIGWNGLYQGRGKPAQQGKYIYELSYSKPRGEKHRQEGILALIR